MKMPLKFVGRALCVLWLGTANAMPAAAFDAGRAAPGGGVSSVIRVAQNELWVQFFEQNRRRDDGNQRRRPRNFEVMPLRTDPGAQQPSRRELRPQERRGDRGREQDAAREAVRRGDILSLGGIIRSVQDHCPGKFLGAKLLRGRDGYSYRVRILRPSGRRIGLTVDARSGAVVGGRCG